MKKTLTMRTALMFFAMFAMVMTIATTQQAKADVESPFWSCSLTFDVKGGGLKILVGHFKMRGKGLISCTDIHGNVEKIPVRVTVGSYSPLSVGIGKMRLLGVATGIGLAGEPSDLLGRYLVASARGSVVIGAGADLALRAAHHALTFNASLQAVSGIGVNLGFDSIVIDSI